MKTLLTLLLLASCTVSNQQKYPANTCYELLPKPGEYKFEVVEYTDKTVKLLLVDAQERREIERDIEFFEKWTEYLVLEEIECNEL